MEDNLTSKILSEIEKKIFDYANSRTLSSWNQMSHFWDGMSEDKRLELARSVDKFNLGKYYEHDNGTIGGTLITTVLLLRLLGLSNTAQRLEFLTHSSIMHSHMRDKIDEIKVKGAISEKNRKNASGAKNAKYNECIAIMKATWQEVPNASKNKMVERVFSHFGGKVSRESLHRWIKQNNFGPLEVVRPAPDFKLVIPS